MKKSINSGELVINYLASCGKAEVAMLDLVKAVAPGCRSGEEMDKAFNMILPVLTGLESGGLVKLSAEAIPSTGFVPKVIHILPKMKKTADRLMQDKSGGTRASVVRKGSPEKGGKASAVDGESKRGGGQRRRDTVDDMCNIFADLFEKKRKTVRIRGEWNRLVTSMAYSDIAEESGFDACVKMFVNGLIWQKRREQAGPCNEPAGKHAKAEPEIRPELLKLIDEIVQASEDKDGALKEGRKGRRAAGDADAPLTRLDRDEIRDFIRSLHDMRDEVQPGRLWREAVSRFMGELLQNMPVYEACMESFRAGIIWQMNRKKLEGSD
jgi:hypothetical protein